MQGHTYRKDAGTSTVHKLSHGCTLHWPNTEIHRKFSLFTPLHRIFIVFVLSGCSNLLIFMGSMFSTSHPILPNRLFSSCVLCRLCLLVTPVLGKPVYWSVSKTGLSLPAASSPQWELTLGWVRINGLRKQSQIPPQAEHVLSYFSCLALLVKQGQSLIEFFLEPFCVFEALELWAFLASEDRYWFLKLVWHVLLFQPIWVIMVSIMYQFCGH